MTYKEQLLYIIANDGRCDAIGDCHKCPLHMCSLFAGHDLATAKQLLWNLEAEEQLLGGNDHCE